MGCEHEFILDKDGEVTCVKCGCRDDEMPQQWKDPYEGFENQINME